MIATDTQEYNDPYMQITIKHIIFVILFTQIRVSPKPFWLETVPLARHLRFEHFE